MKREQRLVDLKIEQSGKPTSEKMTSHGSVSDLPADIVSIDRVLIRLVIVIPWLVHLYVEIIHKLKRVDYLTYRWTNMV